MASSKKRSSRKAKRSSRRTQLSGSARPKRTKKDYKLAYDLGFRDGLAQPYELSMGMTWPDDQEMNESYDRGVNAGQAEGLRREGRPLARRHGNAQVAGTAGGYGVVLHRSPPPMMVVGYYYEDWERHGPRRELYRVPASEAGYRTVMKRIGRGGGSSKEKDARAFEAFRPA